MENDILRRLIWTGLVAGLSALASVAATKVAAKIYIRAFNEEPPE